MTDRHETTDARLERLRLATEPVRPRADFAARVSRAVERDAAPSDWLAELLRPAWKLVPVAALAAALGVVWGAASERASNDALAAASTTELDAEW
ncbi:MAG: hypothetical protein ACLQBL_11040 [Polyangiaceae bacterium]